MPYRGLLYFVAQSASSDYRSDPYATERRCLPNRTHGIRYASAPKRATCIKTYAPSETVRPVSASARAASRSARQNVEPGRVLKAMLIMVLVALVSALLGIVAARALVGAIDSTVIPFASASQDSNTVSLSTPQSSWELGVVPTLYQDDPQWSDRPYGSGTIGDAGAAPLCLAMVRIEMTGDTATGPIEVASYAQSNGLAASSDATALLTDGAAALGLSAREIESNELAMRRELVGDRPIVAAMKAGSFGSSATYIVITGIDEHGELAVHDPLSRDRTSRHWSFEEITSQATGLWSYLPAE